jgi:hypothetical protein
VRHYRVVKRHLATSYRLHCLVTTTRDDDHVAATSVGNGPTDGATTVDLDEHSGAFRVWDSSNNCVDDGLW